MIDCRSKLSKYDAREKWNPGIISSVTLNSKIFCCDSILNSTFAYIDLPAAPPGRHQKNFKGLHKINKNKAISKYQQHVAVLERRPFWGLIFEDMQLPLNRCALGNIIIKKLK